MDEDSYSMDEISRRIHEGSYSRYEIGILIDESSRSMDKISRLIEGSHSMDEMSGFIDEGSYSMDEMSGFIDEGSYSMDKMSRLKLKVVVSRRAEDQYSSSQGPYDVTEHYIGQAPSEDLSRGEQQTAEEYHHRPTRLDQQGRVVTNSGDATPSDYSSSDDAQLFTDIRVAINANFETVSSSDSGPSDDELGNTTEFGRATRESKLRPQKKTGKQANEQPPNDGVKWLDARLLNPRAYLGILDKLKEEVLARSMLKFYSVETYDISSMQEFSFRSSIDIPFPEQSSRKVCRDQDVESIFNAAKRNVTSENLNSNYILNDMVHLIETRNTILRVCDNIDAMKAAMYCEERISILVRDHFRINVARLISIEIYTILELAAASEKALLNLLEAREPLRSLINGPTIKIIDICMTFERIFGLGPVAISFIDRWRLTVQILDLAVASYATAHVGDLQFKSFELHGLLPQQLLFRQRSFQCLEGFLSGNKAWVLEKQDVSNRSSEEPKLYVSTKAETFADIWGPMWRSSLEGPESSDGFQYWVGNGVILPWSHQSSETDSQLIIHDHEVLCHWMSCTNSPKINDSPGTRGQPIKHDSTLLIGAGTRLSSKDCGLSINIVKQQLKDAGLLHIPGTIPRAKHLDAENYTLQGSWSGVTVGAQRSYKIRERTWKQTLVEAWKNDPESRNPQWLEQFLGVEVSACTLNARRRRLISIIGSQTMRKYLESCSVRWVSQECREAFFKSLEPADHTAFYRLWREHEADDGWRKSMGKAISLCLDVLSETGDKSRGFDIFWVHGTPAGQSMVTLSPSEHTWVGFLKDSPDCCTMAVFENVCLEMDKYAVRRCRKIMETETAISATYTVLQTKICFNEDLVAIRKARLYNASNSPYNYRCRLSSLEPDARFSFGENGRLCRIPVSTNADRDLLLMKWKPPNMLHVAASLFGNARVQHHEYLVDEQLETSPVDVIIFSSKGGFSQAHHMREKTPVPPIRKRSPTRHVQMGQMLDSQPINWTRLIPSDKVSNVSQGSYDLPHREATT
ncbi:hypothetical protein QQS21_005510 [Conoideocrella luteorostrata]|uniref:Uncharacterized protein n=1 Tax=Conoideocrella luteorostrata TaxID=1105319 RepID=A0AAJ0FTS4_9HYPO|nr:hypothetical protein QQS21_005510 [Conoideocrella luteorostrata]